MPLEFIEATAGLDDVQVTVVEMPGLPVTVADNAELWPSPSVRLDWAIVTLTGRETTVSVVRAPLLVSAAASAEIVAEPAAMAVTSPVALTEATPELEERQTT